MKRKLLILTSTVVFGLSIAIAAPQQSDQMPQQQGGMQRHRQGVGGEITAINGDTLTLKTFRGDTATVKITSSTRIEKDRAAAKLSDFNVGDRVFVGGEQASDGTWTARMLGTGGPGGMGMGGRAGMNPEDMGKKFIMGQVTKIEGTNITVKRPDGVEQTIAVDDDTSFRKQGQSVTLADITVGEFIGGPGEVKGGTFTAKTLNVGRPRMRGGIGSGNGEPPSGAPPMGAPDGAPGNPPPDSNGSSGTPQPDSNR